MEEYDYKGYTITEDNGYFYVGDNEFYSLDDAMDWIDDTVEEVDDTPSVPYTYHIYYVTKDYNRGYDDFIEAYNEEEAIRKLKRMHRDIAYIADCYRCD